MISSLKKIPFFRRVRSALPESYSLYYRDYIRFRKWIRESREYTADQWYEFRFGQIKQLINLCWDHTEGYRKHWEEAGFHPDQLTALEDISRIPVITKKHIRKYPALFINSRISKRFLAKSGGSTGTPFQFYEPVNLGIIEKAFMHEIWARFYPDTSLKTKSTIIRGRIIKGDLQYDPMNGLILSTYKLTPVTVRKFLEAINRYRTPILHAYPSSLYFVAKIMQEHNLTCDHSFKAVMLGSEKLYGFQKQAIEEVFKAPICHWYGQAEKVVLAGNHPGDTHFHTEPLYGFTELLGANGERVNKGETGEIIGTGYWNRVTPFVRYRTLDRGEATTGSGTSDLKGTTVLKSIYGRIQDVVISKSEAFLSLVTLANVVAQFDEMEEFRFIQEEPGKLLLVYIPRKTGDMIGKDRIQSGIQQVVGDEFEIEVHQVTEISPTPAGKNTYLDQKLDVEAYY